MKIEAQIIGENSAGMVAIEIYEDGKLVYSHNYFTNGASYEYYNDVCTSIVQTDCENSQNWRDFDGCDMDDHGNPILYNNSDYTGVVASWTSEKGWTIYDDDYGMTGDVCIYGVKISDIIQKGSKKYLKNISL